MVAVGPFAILLLLIVVAVVVAVMNTTLKPSGDGKPRGFPWLLMLFGIVIMGGIITLILYRARPDEFLLEVKVSSGKGFVGEVIVDGRREIINGDGSGSYPFTGRNISWIVLIDDATGTDTIEASVDGGIGGAAASDWGCRGSYEKGFFGNGGMFTTIGEEEWNALMQRLRPPNEDFDSILPGISSPSNPVNESEETLEPQDTLGTPEAATPESTSDTWLRVAFETAFT